MCGEKNPHPSPLPQAGEGTLNAYAVMGSPVAHSLSPVIHEAFARQTGRRLIYQKIEIELPRFEQQVIDFFNQGGKGLNISSPGKQRAFAMSAKPSSRAFAAKAANRLMARHFRFAIENGWHHVTGQGNERRAIFRDDGEGHSNVVYWDVTPNS